MTDSNNFSLAQTPSDTANIASYQPPTSTVASPVDLVSAPVSPAQISQDSFALPVLPTSADPAEPSVQTESAAPAESDVAEVDPESLAAQNIFELLGVNDGSDADKEAFLDELQQVIWQDFLENDLKLLLTKAELEQVKELQIKNPDQAKQQEEIIGFIENLVPDIEEIMLEKALELKRQMVEERITGLKEFLGGQTEKLAIVHEAENLIKQNQWASAATILNKI